MCASVCVCTFVHTMSTTLRFLTAPLTCMSIISENYCFLFSSHSVPVALGPEQPMQNTNMSGTMREWKVMKGKQDSLSTL